MCKNEIFKFCFEVRFEEFPPMEHSTFCNQSSHLYRIRHIVIFRICFGVLLSCLYMLCKQVDLYWFYTICKYHGWAVRRSVLRLRFLYRWSKRFGLWSEKSLANVPIRNGTVIWSDNRPVRSSMPSINPYWQITETKSKTWEFTERHLRKQNPNKFQKFHFGKVTERHLRKQNPVEFSERIIVI